MIPQESYTWNILDSSKITTYMRCPRYFFYQYVLGWRLDTPSNHLIFGSAWHLPMEHLLLTDYSNDSVIDGFDLFEAYYRRELGPETDEIFEPKTPYNAFIILGKYAEEYKDDLKEFKPLYTEIAGKVSISETRSLYYRMDSILQYYNNNMVGSLEHKTGSRAWLWREQWELGFQALTYNHVLHCLYPEDLVYGVTMNGTIFLKRKKDPWEFIRHDVRRTKNQMQVWLDNANFWFGRIEDDMELLDRETEDQDVMSSFPMNTNDCLKWNRVCEYQDFCLAWSNPLCKCFAPPLGFKIEHWDPSLKEAKHEINV